MRYKLNKYCCFVLLSISLLSCEELFEPSLQEKEVHLRAPFNNVEVNKGQIVFYWDSIPGAKYYNLQIINGSFDSISNLIIDTNTIYNKLNLTLEQGNLKWRVKAYNQSSSSNFSSTFNLIIK